MSSRNKVLGTTCYAIEGINAVKVTDKVWYYIVPWGDTVRVYKAIPKGPSLVSVFLSKCEATIEKYVGSAPRLQTQDGYSMLRVSAVPAVIPIEEVALLVDHPLDSVKMAVQERLAHPEALR